MIALLGALILFPPPGREIVVDPRGPVATLSAALRLAAPGDRIVIHAGTYHEPEITVDKRVQIIGEGGPVFIGGGHQILTVTADSVTIRGLVLRGVLPASSEDRAAVKFIGVHGCAVENNVLLDTFFGIYLSKSTGCRIAGNRVRGSGRSEALTGNAIHSWSSSDLVIEDNVLSGHRDGIYFEFTTNARVTRNRSSSNIRYGLHFMFSDGCIYRDNLFAHNGAGVAVMYSHDVLMAGNRFDSNWGAASFGLLLKDISDSRVESNRFVSNTVGLYAEGTNRVRFEDNEFNANGWAVKIMANAAGNLFRRNRFLNNAFDVASNSTGNTSVFEENYWDHYTGYDLDRDGYGDVPFRPVRLFSLIVQQNEPALILLRSFFIDLLDVAERVMPVLTPETLVDRRPLMRLPS